jgi:hypothetical protein
MIEPRGYNERLFKGSGLRFTYHMARYHWLASEVRKLAIRKPRIVELGCFDAKTLDFLSFAAPSYYLGLDAGWENGLRLGRQRWKDHSWVELFECSSPCKVPDRGFFDIGICMEALNIMDYETEDAYLRKLGQMCRLLFVTVPREHGLVFFAKHAAKRMLYGQARIPYSWREVALLTLGKFGKVRRQEYKGFDERVLLRIMSRYFKVEKVCGLFPSTAFPVQLSCTVGIVGTSKLATKT